MSYIILRNLSPTNTDTYCFVHYNDNVPCQFVYDNIKQYISKPFNPNNVLILTDTNNNRIELSKLICHNLHSEKDSINKKTLLTMIKCEIEFTFPEHQKFWIHSSEKNISLRSCYVSTIHSSQCLEADVVVIYLTSQNVRIHQLELLYNACSRARNKVILFANTHVLDSCLSTKNKRKSLLNAFLDGINVVKLI